MIIQTILFLSSVMGVVWPSGLNKRVHGRRVVWLWAQQKYTMNVCLAELRNEHVSGKKIDKCVLSEI